MRNRILLLLCFLCVGLQAFAQISISGKVVDAGGLELPGVNVMVKGTTVGTLTDGDGKFMIPDVPGGSNAVLVFSYVGFQTQEIKVGNAKSLTVKLQEDNMALDEVVVVGYGTARKKDVSGAISNVRFSDSEITALPNPNAIAALSSKVAGMKYAPTNSAGGDNMGSMTLRGKNAIPTAATSDKQGVNAPLLIVDGVISFGSINEINTNDVQSIDVLKDASAAAIYGSRAANGVIIITTKKGQSEKPTINVNTNWSFSDWTRQPKMVSNEEKFFRNRFYSKQAGGDIPGDAVWSMDYDKAQLLNTVELDAYNEGMYTNWIDEVSRVGFAQKYAVKTNLAYWATTTLNIGGEIALAPRMTLDMTANYNPFHFRGNKKIMHWAVQPEWRYWTCRRFMGHFIGVHAHGGKYNGGLKKYRYDGWGVGGGFSYGYQWIIGKHWNLETELGIGYAYLKYDKYLRNRCGRFIDTGHRNYWGPTKLSISFMYLFKSRQK